MIKILKFLASVSICILALILACISAGAIVAMLMITLCGIMSMAFFFLGEISTNFWDVFIITIKGFIGLVAIVSIDVIIAHFMKGALEWLND